MDDANGEGNKNNSCNKKILHIGSMIYLCFCEDDTEYYTTCEGFTKNKVRLKTKDQLNSEGSFT